MAGEPTASPAATTRDIAASPTASPEAKTRRVSMRDRERHRRSTKRATMTESPVKPLTVEEQQRTFVEHLREELEECGCELGANEVAQEEWVENLDSVMSFEGRAHECGLSDEGLVLKQHLYAWRSHSVEQRGLQLQQKKRLISLSIMAKQSEILEEGDGTSNNATEMAVRMVWEAWRVYLADLRRPVEERRLVSRTRRNMLELLTYGQEVLEAEEEEDVDKDQLSLRPEAALKAKQMHDLDATINTHAARLRNATRKVTKSVCAGVAFRKSPFFQAADVKGAAPPPPPPPPFPAAADADLPLLLLQGGGEAAPEKAPAPAPEEDATLVSARTEAHLVARYATLSSSQRIHRTLERTRRARAKFSAFQARPPRTALTGGRPRRGLTATPTRRHRRFLYDDTTTIAVDSPASFTSSRPIIIAASSSSSSYESPTIGALRLPKVLVAADGKSGPMPEEWLLSRFSI